MFQASQNSTFKAKNNNHNFIFKPKGDVPSQYLFFVKIEDFETEVPTINKFSINNYTLCDDVIKVSVILHIFTTSIIIGITLHCQI